MSTLVRIQDLPPLAERSTCRSVPVQMVLTAAALMVRRSGSRTAPPNVCGPVVGQIPPPGRLARGGKGGFGYCRLNCEHVPTSGDVREHLTHVLGGWRCAMVGVVGHSRTYSGQACGGGGGGSANRLLSRTVGS